MSAPLFNGGGADHAVGDPNYGHRSAWGLVAALTLVNVIAQVDRFAMTLLITPMQRDLGLNDTQMGLIGGLVTGVFFAAAGLPLARLADQVNRKYLIVISLVGWSLMTMASGLAIGFWTLCLARLLLSVGEASLGPAANSMISNVFPSNRLSQPLSVFAAAGSLGNAVASGLVALLLAFAAWAPDLLTFGDAPMAPWRIVMLGLGLAGVVPLVGMLLVREPARPVDDARPGFKAFVAHLRPRWKAYAPCYLGYAFFVLPFVALAFWVPTAFERAHGMSTTTSGVWLGLGYLVAGTPGTLVGGWLAQRWLAAGRTDGNLRVLLLATCIALPAAALSQIVGNPTVGLGFVWVGMFIGARHGRHSGSDPRSLPGPGGGGALPAHLHRRLHGHPSGRCHHRRCLPRPQAHRPCPRRAGGGLRPAGLLGDLAWLAAAPDGAGRARSGVAPRLTRCFPRAPAFGLQATPAPGFS